MLELSRDLDYDGIALALTEALTKAGQAEALGLNDPALLRFTGQQPFVNAPKLQPLKWHGFDTLQAIMTHYSNVLDSVFYEVLDIPLRELEQLKTLTVRCRCPSIPVHAFLLAQKSIHCHSHVSPAAGDVYEMSWRPPATILNFFAFPQVSFHSNPIGSQQACVGRSRNEQAGLWGQVNYHGEKTEQVSSHNVRLPKDSSVADVLEALRMQLPEDKRPAALRLLEVFYSKIYKVTSSCRTPTHAPTLPSAPTPLALDTSPPALRRSHPCSAHTQLTYCIWTEPAGSVTGCVSA